MSEHLHLLLSLWVLFSVVVSARLAVTYSTCRFVINDVSFCSKHRVVFNLPFEVENVYGEMRVLSEKVCKFFGRYHFMT